MRKIRPLLPLLFLIISIEGIQAQNNVGIGTTNPQAKLDINGDIIIRGFALPAVDGVNTSLDINTDRFSNYKIFGPTADFVIAGITAGMDGRLITLQNKSGFIMQLTNEDISALPEDQIITGTGTTIDINASGSITLQYDVDLAKWIVLSKNHILSGGGGGSFWDLSGNNIFNNNSGNIGIGLSNPGYKLTIRTGTRDYGFIHTDGTITFGSYVGSSAATGISAGWLGTISQHQLNIFTGNGTAQAIFKTDYGFDLVGPKPYMRLLDGSTVSGDFRADVANLEIAAFKANLLGVPGNIILQADDISQFSSKYAGNVGIGLRNPIGRLHIVHGGPTAHLILEFPGLNDYSRLLFTNTGASRYWGIAGKASTGSINGDRLSFYNNGGAEVMVMTGDGNVGIGTPNPTYRLAVNGNIRSKEVVVESGWADYVFDHHYNLPTLAELETFINRNKHLPNVPSAQEIAENGLAVGDVQRRMMEKIEELTLYVIQLKKEIEELKSNRK